MVSDKHFKNVTPKYRNKPTHTQRPKRIPKVTQKIYQKSFLEPAGHHRPSLYPPRTRYPPKIMNNQLKMLQKCDKGEPNPRILGPGSWILDPGSKILDPKS